MKQAVYKAFFLTVCVSFFIILICGCEEEQLTPNEKKCRLIAAENIELHELLAKKDKEIERLKRTIEKCNVEKEEQKRQLEDEMNSAGEFIINIVLENEQLKKQIEELKNK